MCTSVLLVFCVAPLHALVCHGGKLFVAALGPQPHMGWNGGGGWFWGCRPSHLNASMSVAVSLLRVKHYEIWPPRCNFGKLNFYVSFTVGHTGQQSNFLSVFRVPVDPGCQARTPKTLVWCVCAYQSVWCQLRSCGWCPVGSRTTQNQQGAYTTTQWPSYVSNLVSNIPVTPSRDAH